MKAVIQAGGRGVRLRPYTSVLPKPLMPIGARPVVELLLKWLRRNGIKDRKTKTRVYAARNSVDNCDVRYPPAPGISPLYGAKTYSPDGLSNARRW